MSGYSSIDVPKIEENFEGMEDVLKELIQSFLEKLPGMMEKIRHSIEGKDLKLIQQSAHALKGAISHFYPLKVTSILIELESFGKKNMEGTESVYQKIDALLLDLEKELNLVIKEIQNYSEKI